MVLRCICNNQFVINFERKKNISEFLGWEIGRLIVSKIWNLCLFVSSRIMLFFSFSPIGESDHRNMEKHNKFFLSLFSHRWNVWLPPNKANIEKIILEKNKLLWKLLQFKYIQTPTSETVIYCHLIKKSWFFLFLIIFFTSLNGYGRISIQFLSDKIFNVTNYYFLMRDIDRWTI